ncbi:DNA cytosine methyltransferase [Anatilimnocola floriformis]|uniref:DNA cytosine methyltransferase n=1 Tax=Anatilimnocola floriformis TaxID=2948575 RepID=UPI0020C4B0C7|nr:DNA cytosine methyltransferase [Anatilimnocola floriformis]
MAVRSPTFLSLFCGCGGFDQGFHNAGFRSLGAFDIDEAALAVYRKNLPYEATACDLATVTFSRISGCDVVVAGPPCQGFSTIGKRRVKDPRNNLLVTAAEQAVRISPRAIILENVAGAIAGTHARYWRKASLILRSGGYQVQELLCRADEMGLAQIRKRVLLVAWKTRFRGDIELPQCKGGTLRDAIFPLTASLPNHFPKYLDAATHSGRIAKRIQPGQKLSNVRVSERSVHTWEIPEVFGTTNAEERRVLTALIHRRRQKRVRDFGDGDPVSARSLAYYLGRPVARVLKALVLKGYLRCDERGYELTHTFNGKYRRLTWDAPAPTVDTKYGDPRYFLHPDEDRAFSVREAARIQGFSDAFEFSGNEKHQYLMIANAVPPPLADTIASYLSRTILQ